MIEQGFIFPLLALLERCDPDKKEKLLKYLPEGDQDELQKLSSVSFPFLKEHKGLADFFKEIHYSWIITFLGTFSEGDQLIFIASFEDEEAEKLCEMFDISSKRPILEPLAKHFVHSILFEWLTKNQKEFLPYSFLPDNPLNFLLSLKKSELVTLADLLGLHDLSAETRHIIQSKTLTNIQTLLKKDKLSYFKELLKQQEPVTFAPLGLEKWDGDKDKLLKILHNRGINRIAKALYGSHPALLWHISHRLDTGRAKILKKHCSDIKNKKAHKILTSQLLTLAKRITTS